MKTTCVLLNNNPNRLSFKQANDKTTFIYDLDGTLIDSAPLQKEAWQETADEAAKRYSRKPISVDEYYNHGMSRADNLTHMFERLNLPEVPQEVRDSFGKVKAELYEEVLQKMVKEKGPDSLLIKGARRFLEVVKNNFPEAKKIVASSALGAVSAINAAKLDNFFSKSHNPPTLIDGADKGILYAKSKPEPDIFLAAAKMQNAEPANCIVFEDSLEGIEAATKAGMKFVLIGDFTPKNLYELMIGRFKNFDEIKISQLIKFVECLKR